MEVSKSFSGVGEQGVDPTQEVALDDFTHPTLRFIGMVGAGLNQAPTAQVAEPAPELPSEDK